MRMTEHDGSVPCGDWIDCQLRDVMQHEEIVMSHTNNRSIRQLPCPRLTIDAATNRIDWGDSPQLLKHLSTADIPGMDDEVLAF